MRHPCYQNIAGFISAQITITAFVSKLKSVFCFFHQLDPFNMDTFATVGSNSQDTLILRIYTEDKFVHVNLSRSNLNRLFSF